MFTTLNFEGWKPLLYIVTILAFVLLNFFARKKLPFSLRIITALILGAVVGLLFGNISSTIKFIGDGYVRLIKALVMPLVFAGILRSFISLDDTNKLRKLGVKSLFWLLLTTAIGSVIGILFATVTKIGTGFPTVTERPAKAIIPIEKVLLDLLPDNIVSSLSNNTNIIPVIVFAVIIAIAVIIENGKHPEKVKPFKDLVESFSTIIFRVTKLIIRLTPYAVFALVANAAGRNTLSTLKVLGIYIVVIYLAMLFHFIFIQMGLITFGAKLNPIRYLSKIYPAQLVAFTTQSSYGTLPVTIKSLTNRVGVSERVANFVGPLGANIGMNACGGIFPAIVSIFTANAFGYVLSPIDYVMIVFTCTIASIGIAGVPGIASMAATVVLAGVGLPLEGVWLVIAVDALVDMGRTLVNVTGTTVAATLVAKSEGELDLTIFNNRQTEVLDITQD